MPTPLSNERRIAQLETELARLARELEALRSREPRLALPRQLRLAKTAHNSSYPASGDTFGLIFLDGSFTETEGSDQTPTTVDRAGEVQVVAHSLSGRYISEGYKVWAVQLGEQWWILDGLGRIWFFELNEDFGATTAGEADADLLHLTLTVAEAGVTILDQLGALGRMQAGDRGVCWEEAGVYYGLWGLC